MGDINVIKKRYETLSETDDLIVVLTPERVRKEVNKSYCKFFGRTASQLIGTCIIDEFPESKKAFYTDFIKGMTRQSPSIHTVQKTHNTGEDKWVYWTENGIYDDNGQLVEIVSVGRDINENIETRRAKDEMTNMLLSFRDAIYRNVTCSITDTQGVITFVNSHFCEISQYSVSELVGKTHAVVNSGYHDSEFYKDLWGTISAGKMWHGEIRNKAKDGNYYWEKTVIIPVKDAEMNISSYLSLRILLTDKKQREEERIRYIKSLEEMLYMVSHELRSPITNFMGLLEVLKTMMPENHESQLIIAYMLESVLKLDEYSRKMNDYLQENKKITDSTI